MRQNPPTSPTVSSNTDDSAGPVPQFPVAAVRLLRERFEEFAAHYRSAVNWPPDNDDSVHQLRVSSRRLSAALDTLRPLLPEKPRRQLNRQLKRVRRAAGDARDLDVFLERVNSDEFPLDRKSRERVLKFLEKSRKNAQKPLRRVHRKRSPKNLHRRLDAVLEGIPRRNREFLLNDSACGADILAAAVARFSAEVPQSFEEAADLHQLRISSKRLRYSLETVLDLQSVTVPKVVEQVVARLKTIQDHLGTINDCTVARRRLTVWEETAKRRALRAAFQQMADIAAARADKESAAFRRWWSNQRQRGFQTQLNKLAGASSS